MGLHTDLAMERQEQLQRNARLTGITLNEEGHGAFRLTAIRVETEEAAHAIEKPVGTYLTLEHPSMTALEAEEKKIAAALFANALAPLLPHDAAMGTVLIVGLGNRRITPDLLGPAAAGKIFVTRHLMDQCGITDIDGIPLRAVCAISPGVLGTTGLETETVIEGICKELHPSCVICIDALAAMERSRLFTTVQIADTGITPGSGVGGHTRALNEETLGCPVLAVGVPTVVYTSVLCGCADGDDLLVTPRNIDEATEALSDLLADGINKALQPDLPKEKMIL